MESSEIPRLPKASPTPDVGWVVVLLIAVGALIVDWLYEKHVAVLVAIFAVVAIGAFIYLAITWTRAE